MSQCPVFYIGAEGSELRFSARGISILLESISLPNIFSKKLVEILLSKITGAYVSHVGMRREAGEIHDKHVKGMHMMRTTPLRECRHCALIQELGVWRGVRLWQMSCICTFSTVHTGMCRII